MLRKRLCYSHIFPLRVIIVCVSGCLPQKGLFILNKDVNDLESEHLAELFASKNRCSEFFKGHLGEKEMQKKEEEI